ncbi:GNAT family N-acetyltransferase [Hyphomicrobium sp. CS1GBMeth3]|uniref:GNAT family N-acetyltransferase n=1 Tax=Hyphomicrobium sp. CS1GBMeth3 TaxID=1892845 RepID=UPI0009309097|nr:GNAT family N-acetyltransferase [Hyphomicrobium sp. CS1GBMeth3]
MSLLASVVERPSDVVQRVTSASAERPLLRVVTTRAEFDALEPAWNALFARAGRNTHLFQTFNWLWHWANHFLPKAGERGPGLAVVTAHAEGRLIMVWPLVVERVGPLTVLEWMGEPVSQYGDVLMEARPDAEALLRAAFDLVTQRTGASVVNLRRVRGDSVVAPLLESIGASVTAELKAPFLDLASAPSFAVYETRYSSNARRNRKRQRRRLAERGALELVWHTEGAKAAALTSEAFQLKRQWMQHRGLVSPALSDPRTERFFTDAVRSVSHPAGCHVIGLICAGRPVALEIGVRAKGRTAIHIIAYDLEFEKMAAGALLMEDSIRRASDDGLAVFDLLAPGDGYKLDWADDAVVVRDWAVAPTLSGRLYLHLYLNGARPTLKRGVEALPIGARRKLAQLLTRGREA